MFVPAKVTVSDVVLTNAADPANAEFDATVPDLTLWFLVAVIVPPWIVPAVKFTSLTVSVCEFNSNVALFSTVKSSSSGKTFEEPNVTVVPEPEILVLMLSWVLSLVSINAPIVCEPVITISPCPFTFPVWL